MSDRWRSARFELHQRPMPSSRISGGWAMITDSIPSPIRLETCHEFRSVLKLTIEVHAMEGSQFMCKLFIPRAGLSLGGGEVTKCRKSIPWAVSLRSGATEESVDWLLDMMAGSGMYLGPSVHKTIDLEYADGLNPSGNVHDHQQSLTLSPRCLSHIKTGVPFEKRVA